MGHDVRQAGEPSVEEILESIKKVIARDNRAEADQVRRRREEDGMVTTRTLRAEDLPDVDMPVVPAPAISAPTGTPAIAPAYIDDEPAPVLELTDAEMAVETPGEPDADREVAPPADEAADLDDDDLAEDAMDEPEPVAETPLLAESARVSMRESLSALAMLAEPGARPQIVRSGETSLEGLTRDLLRPMLGEWLEKNLPQMVDKLVAAEIARIVGKRG